jgi:hypothetical protein
MNSKSLHNGTTTVRAILSSVYVDILNVMTPAEIQVNEFKFEFSVISVCGLCLIGNPDVATKK